jgi:hypothetical protein
MGDTGLRNDSRSKRQTWEKCEGTATRVREKMGQH